MDPRQDFHEDFGITGLSRYIGMQLKYFDAPGCLDLVLALSEDRGGSAYVKEVLDDARRLARSSLPDEALSALWLAAVNGRFDPARANIPVRAWFDRIADTCIGYVRRDDPSFEPEEPERDGHPELGATVLAELRAVEAVLAEKAVTNLYVPPLPGLVPALDAAVTALGSDLGFRLFLRAMKVYFVPIGPGRLARFEEIGRVLGYHDWVVEDGNLNVWSDLED
ncbi:hypothetical protein [Kitasatospora sp. NPDC015120]|uniref:hypothetical protein n=1 Tax=Kitasatospora sp. NPDC015120 TaxID=3364023 RepID=UPI0036F463BB